MRVCGCVSVALWLAGFSLSDAKRITNPFIFINSLNGKYLRTSTQNGKLSRARVATVAPFPPLCQCCLFMCCLSRLPYAQRPRPLPSPCSVKGLYAPRRSKSVGAAFSQVKLCFVALPESGPNFSNKMKLFWIIEIRNLVALFHSPSLFLSRLCSFLFFSLLI